MSRRFSSLEFKDEVRVSNELDKATAYLQWSMVAIGIIVLLLAAIKFFYFECNFYQVEFTHGDSYYVEKGSWKVHDDGKIEFRSWLWNRKVEGYDYRIIEPIFK